MTDYPSIYSQSLALLTDFYQLTMAYGYWKTGLTAKEAVFHLFFRRRPFQGGFTIAAGLESAIAYLERLQFDSSDLAYLEGLKDANDRSLFSREFLDYLSNLRFACDIDAIPEGSVVFPYEPLVRVKGPLLQCQLLESPLLNQINFPTLIATKAARVCLAAGNDPVLEFGIRRAQGADGALTASRAAYIGGCDSTSHVLAGKLFGIPVKGTHAHSWIMVFDSEREAMSTYIENFPTNCIFLVDTYDTLEGVRNAVEVGKKLVAQGKTFHGVRLDSGDLAYLSIKSREILDAAGFTNAKIVASNELDEVVISELKRQGARIDIWGVGTNLVTGGTQAALDGVYKLSAIRDPGGKWNYKLKLSEQMVKISNPGILQVRRFYNKQGYVADAIYDLESGLPNSGCQIVEPLDPTKQIRIPPQMPSKDLLVPVMRQGKCVYSMPSLDKIRSKTKEELALFPAGIKRFLNPHQYFVGLDKTLYDMKVQRIHEIRHQFLDVPLPAEEE